MKKLIFFFITVFIFGTSYAQNSVSGTVVDSEVGSGLPGASVVVKGTSDGVSTDFNGAFTISVETGATLVVSYIGYDSVEVVVGESGDLGTIELTPGENILSGVTVFGNVSLAKDRETPVAVSTLTTAEIEDRIGNLELPELLNSTPGVYATRQGGAFGDSRINIRGFRQENIAVLINGMPVNDMENGRVYWSNWAGLTDVVSAMQVQRGLGSSPLPISSVGGTINIVTKSTELSKGGKVAVRVGNDGYIKKTLNYNTGVMDGGHALSFVFSRTAGDGIVDFTEFEAYSYFLGYGWKSEDDKNNVQLIVTGAPQTHGQRTTSYYNMARLSDYIEHGIYYNYNGGYYNGESFNMRKNFYHKPIASLNWESKLSSSQSLSVTAYASYGRGGGTGDLGRIGSYFSSGRFRNADTGQVLWDEIAKSNSGVGGTWSYGGGYSNAPDVATGLYIVNDPDNYVDGRRRNGFIRRASVNSHNWFGGLVNYKNQVNDNLAFQIGADVRYYTGIHYRRLDNLLGADGYRDFDNVNYPGGFIAKKEYSSDLSNLWNVFKSTDDEAKIDYHNDGVVSWAGVFGQVEYVTEETSVFVQGSVANQGFQRIDYFRYTVDDPMHKSDTKNILGGTIKAGANFNLDAQNNVFVNTGYYSKAPNFDAVFQDYDNFVTPDEELRNEKVLGLELGYGFRSSDFNMNINLFRTSWKDRFLYEGVRINGESGQANYTGIEQLHTGIELDAVWNISPFVKLEGMLTLGNYEYGGNSTDDNVTNNDGVSIGSSTLYLDGIKVGDGGQTTGRLNLTVFPTSDFKFNLALFGADNIFSNINAEDFDEPDGGNAQLPAYKLFDFGAGYNFDLFGNNAYLRLNINNVFDEEYYPEMENNYLATDDSTNYMGINTANRIFPGWGRTWNVGLTYRF